MQAVLFIGIPGSGKSTFFRERFFETHVRINLDMLRTRRREKLLLEACLEGRQPFVVDNTNVLASERAIYIVAARSFGFHVTGYFFETDLRAALGRNRQRTRMVPVPGLIGKWKRLQRPLREEGFEDLRTVRIVDGAFVVGE